jgi:hypothetical protein
MGKIDQPPFCCAPLQQNERVLRSRHCLPSPNCATHPTSPNPLFPLFLQQALYSKRGGTTCSEPTHTRPHKQPHGISSSLLLSLPNFQILQTRSKIGVLRVTITQLELGSTDCIDYSP